MNKNVLFGIAAFGGLLLIASLFLGGSPESPNQESQSEAGDVATLPENFDSRFPLYPGSEVVAVRESEGEDSYDISISLSAEATKAEVHDWYRDALKKNGWSIKSDKNVAGYQIIQGENENLYTSLQTASSNEAGYVIISQHAKVKK